MQVVLVEDCKVGGALGQIGTGPEVVVLSEECCSGSNDGIVDLANPEDLVREVTGRVGCEANGERSSTEILSRDLVCELTSSHSVGDNVSHSRLELIGFTNSSAGATSASTRELLVLLAAIRHLLLVR